MEGCTKDYNRVRFAVRSEAGFKKYKWLADEGMTTLSVGLNSFRIENHGLLSFSAVSKLETSLQGSKLRVYVESLSFEKGVLVFGLCFESETQAKAAKESLDRGFRTRHVGDISISEEEICAIIATPSFDATLTKVQRILDKVLPRV